VTARDSVIRTGASLAALAIEKVNPNFAREYAKLPDHVLKRIGGG